MPLYEYECGECGEVVTDFPRTFSIPLLTKCPKCGGELRELFSPPAIFIGKMPISGHRKFSLPHYDGKKP